MEHRVDLPYRQPVLHAVAVAVEQTRTYLSRSRSAPATPSRGSSRRSAGGASLWEMATRGSMRCPQLVEHLVAELQTLLVGYRSPFASVRLQAMEKGNTEKPVSTSSAMASAYGW